MCPNGARRSRPSEGRVWWLRAPGRMVRDADGCVRGIVVCGRLRERVDVVREDEPDTYHQVQTLGREQSQSRFAIGALTGFDITNARAQVSSRTVAAEVGAIIE